MMYRIGVKLYIYIEDIYRRYMFTYIRVLYSIICTRDMRYGINIYIYTYIYMYIYIYAELHI